MTSRRTGWAGLLLALTAQLAVLVAAGWALGILLQDLLGADDAPLLDRPVVLYLAEHRTAWLTTVLRELTRLGSTSVLIPLVGVVGLVAFRRTRSWAPLAQMVLSLGGAIALCDLVKPLVDRARPQMAPLVATATGYSFPSGHATQTAAVSVTLALLGGALTTSWPRKVAVWAAAVVVSLVVALSRVYLGVHWPTDVLAGVALGSLWAVLCSLGLRAQGGVVGSGGPKWSLSHQRAERPRRRSTRKLPRDEPVAPPGAGDPDGIS